MLLNYFAAKEKFPLGCVAYRNNPLAFVGGGEWGESAIRPAVCCAELPPGGGCRATPRVAATSLCPAHLCSYTCGSHIPLLVLCVSDEEG